MGGRLFLCQAISLLTPTILQAERTPGNRNSELEAARGIHRLLISCFALSSGALDSTDVKGKARLS